MVLRIYALTCVDTDCAYIGCTASKIAKRMREHRCLLRAGKHTSQKLQDAWDRYGEDRFECIILQAVDADASVENRRKYEQRWLDEYDRQGRLYNSYKISHSIPRSVTMLGVEASRGVAGNRWTPETNHKRRLAQLGKPKNHGHKISATKRAKRAMR